MRYTPLGPVRWRVYDERRSNDNRSRLDDPKRFPGTIRLAFTTRIQRDNDDRLQRMEELWVIVLFIAMLVISSLVVYGIRVKKAAQIEQIKLETHLRNYPANNTEEDE